MRKILNFVFVLFLIPSTLMAQDSSRTILVLDASGSMWGQIDGTAKITIAQDVIGDLLQSLPADQELGLTVYGHRRKGDCADIETLILPGGDQRAAIASAVNAIKPKGKTPLSAAVIAAANALRYSEERATVILVSDGKETCDFDPCEVGRQLEATGVDFTAHVIGFDISDPADRAELQCLAEETGGTFRTAANAAELTEALAVVAEPAPVFSLSFIATEGQGGPVITQGLTWSLGQTANGPWLFQNQPGSSAGFDQLPVGPLFVQVTRQKDGASTQLALMVDENTPGTTILVLPELAPIPQKLSAVARETGSNATIQTPLSWTITNSETGAVLVDDQLTAHPEVTVLPGQYQVTVERAKDGASATQTIAIDSKAELAVLFLPEITEPAPLKMNAREKGVNGMIRRDLIWTLYDHDGTVVLDHVTGNTASTTVLPGRYRVEVLRPEDEHIEELDFAALRNGTTVTVTFPAYLPPATLAAPDSAVAGSEVLVDWTGPNEENDYVVVAKTGSADHKQITYEYTRTGPTLPLQMPSQPGTYELRYVLNQSRQALARKMITVTPATATLTAPETASAGAHVPIDWTGPDYQNDFVDVVQADAAKAKSLNYAYTRNGSPAMVQMPADPGNYLLRYIMNQDRTVLATRAITVADITASINAADSAPAGDTITVDWTGPDYQNDFLAVAEIGMKDNKYITYTYTRKGAPLQLQMPPTPGNYELRYIMSQDRKVLARRPIEITKFSTNITAPANATAGDTIAVQWSGPDYRNDFIAVAEVGMPGNKYVTYAYTRQGSPLDVKLPMTPGAYELRYVVKQDKSVAARVPITIDPVLAELSAADSAVAGSQMQVTWQGPDYQNDYISIAAIGSADTKSLTYTYARKGNPLDILVPTTPGTYELRYVAKGTPTTALTRRNLTVTEVTASLRADATVIAGGEMMVTWEGPNYPRDYITISEVGDKGYVFYTSTSKGSPARIKVPEAPGNYEIRYVINQDRRVIARIDLTVQ